MKDVVIKWLRENAIDLLCQVDLSKLQLWQVVCHHGVLEISLHHLFQEDHIATAELTKALVQENSNLRVTSLFVINHRLNIIFAFTQAFNELMQVFEHKLSVWEDLLVLLQIPDGLGGDLPLVVKDRHCVKVLLAVEKHIKTGSTEIVKTELVRYFAEERALWQKERVYVQNL